MKAFYFACDHIIPVALGAALLVNVIFGIV